MAQNKIKKSKIPVKIAKPSSEPKVKFEVNYYAGIVIAAVTFLIYMNTFRLEYALDDTAAITDNKFVQQGISGIPDLMTTDFWHFSGPALGYYRPLSLITFAVEYQFFGLSPHFSHFNNVLLFTITTFLLFLLMSRLFSGYNFLFPFIISLLFALHPIHTEIVANIKGRDELLSFLNTILMLVFVMRFYDTRKKLFLWLSLLFFYLALLSKESAMAGILLIPLFLYYCGDIKITDLVKKSIPFVLVIAFFLIQKAILYQSVNVVVQSDNVNYPYNNELVRSSSAFMMFLVFIRLLVIPYPLMHDYSYNQIPAVHWDNMWALLGLAGFITILIFGLAGLRKKTITGFAICSYFILISPAFGFILMRGGTFAERLLFSPSLPYCILLTFAIIKLARVNLNKKISLTFSSLRPVLIVSPVFLVIFCLFSLETISRNPAWKDSFTLFATDLKKGPECSLIQYHYGCELMNLYLKEKPKEKNKSVLNGYLNDGLVSIKQAIKIFPHFSDAYYSLGNNYEFHAYDNNSRAYLDSAISSYNMVLEMDSKEYRAYLRLGYLYQMIGNNEQASYNFNVAYMLHPESVDAKTQSDLIKRNTGLDVKVKPGTRQQASGIGQ
jgi:protein O-mannosyl-transferase